MTIPEKGADRASRSIPRLVRVLLLLAAAGLVLMLARTPPRRSYETLRGLTMGTTYTVRFRTPQGRVWPAAETDRLARRIDRCLADVNARMSTFLPDSELSEFNRAPADAPFELSPELFEVFEAALEVSDRSAGAFDVTVGPLVNAYGFGPPPEPPNPPTAEQLETLRQRVGRRLLTLDPQARTLRKAHPDVYCDLSGIAKGYGVDQVARVMEAEGLADYMVEIGGEVRAAGRNPDERPWRIGIERPMRDGHRMVIRVVDLADRSLATSGDYRNYHVSDGQTYSHMIDPRTGRPVEHALASVTVVDTRAMMADAWATALMVLGPEEGYNLAEAAGLAALFQVRTADDDVAMRATSAFSALSANPTDP